MNSKSHSHSAPPNPGPSDGLGLWSSILRQTSASKSIPTKTLLVLGDKHAGKSTLVHHLQGLGLGHTHGVDANAPNTSASAPSASVSTDLALSYSYADIKDQDTDLDLDFDADPIPQQQQLNSADTDATAIVARLGIYQLASPSYHSLLHIPKDKLAQSMAIIVLDWTRPHTWLAQLRSWLLVLEHIVNHSVDQADRLDRERAAFKSSASSSPAAAAAAHATNGGMRNNAVASSSSSDDENDNNNTTNDQHDHSVLSSWFDKLCAANEKHIREYIDPASHPHISDSASQVTSSTTMNPSTALTLLAAAAGNHDISLPLGNGVLTHNLGIPIAFVCTKSDFMATLEREWGMNDDVFDYMQQVLRTVALAYGASVFYTSLSKSAPTFSLLRNYIHFRLFPPPVHSHLSVPMFTHTGNVIERDTVFVPSGWDSLGKIKIQRSHAGLAAMSSAQALPIDFEPDTLAAFPNDECDDVAQTWTAVVPNSAASNSTGVPAAVNMMGGAGEQPLGQPQVAAMDEQAFLERQLAALRATATSGSGGASTVAPGTPPPPSSLDAYGMDENNINAKLPPSRAPSANGFATTTTAGATATANGSAPPVIQRTLPNMPTTPSTAANGGMHPGMVAASPSAAMAALGATASPSDQNAVLANFFQSLISNRAGAGAGAGAGGPASPSPSPAAQAGAQQQGRPPVAER